MNFLELNEYYTKGGQDLWNFIRENDFYLEFFEFLSDRTEYDAIAWLYKGHLLSGKSVNSYFKKNVKKQLEYYENAYELNPNHPYINHYIGQWYMINENNYEKAIKYLIYASEHIEEHFKTLIECYLALNDNIKAILSDFKYFRLHGKVVCDIKKMSLKKQDKINIYKQCYQQNPEKTDEYFNKIQNITINISLTEYIKMKEENEALKLCPGSEEYQKARENFQKLNLYNNNDEAKE